MGSSPRGCRESDKTERLYFHFHFLSYSPRVAKNQIGQSSFHFETIMVSVGVSFSMLMHYNDHVTRLKDCWKLILLPSLAYLILTSYV